MNRLWTGIVRERRLSYQPRVLIAVAWPLPVPVSALLSPILLRPFPTARCVAPRYQCPCIVARCTHTCINMTDIICRFRAGVRAHLERTFELVNELGNIIPLGMVDSCLRSLIVEYP